MPVPPAHSTISPSSSMTKSPYGIFTHTSRPATQFARHPRRERTVHSVGNPDPVAAGRPAGDGKDARLRPEGARVARVQRQVQELSGPEARRQTLGAQCDTEYVVAVIRRSASTTHFSFCGGGTRSALHAMYALAAHEARQHRAHMVEPRRVEAGIHADEERVVHHRVGVCQVADDAMRDPRGRPGAAAGCRRRADASRPGSPRGNCTMSRAAEAGVRAHGDHEPEPRRLGVRRRHRQHQAVGVGRERVLRRVKLARRAAPEAIQLLAAGRSRSPPACRSPSGCNRVAVDVLVVVAVREAYRSCWLKRVPQVLLSPPAQ